MQKDIVLRSHPQAVSACCQPLDICSEDLPEIYDVLEMDNGQIIKKGTAINPSDRFQTAQKLSNALYIGIY